MINLKPNAKAKQFIEKRKNKRILIEKEIHEAKLIPWFKFRTSSFSVYVKDYLKGVNFNLLTTCGRLSFKKQYSKYLKIIIIKGFYVDTLKVFISIPHLWKKGKYLIPKTNFYF